MRRRDFTLGAAAVAAHLTLCGRLRGQAADRQRAAAALRRAVQFFRDQVSADGGYLWRYSADLQRQEGEGRGSRTTAWVQPPGTPTVGDAFLQAYRRTGEPYLLDAARETAAALVRGQLESGGWDYRIEFDPEDRRRYRYRVDPSRRDARNVTTLDDNTTQAALRFLMRVDGAMEFRDSQIHQAALYALDKLIQVQYPNGAWPQRFSGPSDAEQYPVRRARYPANWSRTYSKTDYRSYYTFNDNSIADMISTMFEAADVYGDPRYGESAEKAGGFILLAQMPDPQPAWAQQYNTRMEPAWARKFEPPAVTGGESQGVMRTLLSLYRRTGDRKYLQPLPRALGYLKQSRLPDGRLARFYELRTNRPLYFTRQYELTYRDDDLPTHYGFQVGSSLESIERDYQRLIEMPWVRPEPPSEDRKYRLTRALAAAAKKLIDQQDDRGAWVEPGRLQTYGDDDTTTRVIETRTFARNVETLSRFLAAAR